MPIWKITPVADVSDPRWQDSAIWEEVLVEADSAALARTVAASLDTGAVPQTILPNDVRSRFTDEKLYRVDRLDPAGLPEDVRARAREPDGRGRIVAQRRLGAA